MTTTDPSSPHVKAPLVDFIRANVKNPKDEEIEEILSIFHHQSFKKGEYFKEGNTVCTVLGFILSGSLRTFGVKENGDEVTGGVTTEGFISEIMSVRTGKPSPIALQFLEDSNMLVASVPEYQRLLETNLALNILVREFIAERALEIGRRHMLFLSGTAKERYQFFMESNPRPRSGRSIP